MIWTRETSPEYKNDDWLSGGADHLHQNGEYRQSGRIGRTMNKFWAGNASAKWKTIMPEKCCTSFARKMADENKELWSDIDFFVPVQEVETPVIGSGRKQLATNWSSWDEAEWTKEEDIFLEKRKPAQRRQDNWNQPMGVTVSCFFWIVEPIHWNQVGRNNGLGYCRAEELPPPLENWSISMRLLCAVRDASHTTSDAGGPGGGISAAVVLSGALGR
jgi:hypothetical protein